MKKYIVVLICLVLLCSCAEVYRYTSDTFYAMNTVVDVIKNEEIKEDFAESTILDIEKRMSRTLENSEISMLNEGNDVGLSQDTLNVLEKAFEIAKNTDYAFNPALGNLTDLWDITSGRNYVPTEAEIKDALSKCCAEDVQILDGKVILPENMKIDLGGVAKGYALERACESMEESAMGRAVSADFCISLGGNVGVSGSSKSRKENGKDGWNVGITNPFDKGGVVGTVLLCDGYVSVSGAYERFFEKDGKIYHHIFDSKTGYPAVTDLASAVVISNDGLLSDALSTALFVKGCDEAVEFYKLGLYDFDMILITNSREIIVAGDSTDGFVVDENCNDFVKYSLNEWLDKQ